VGQSIVSALDRRRTAWWGIVALLGFVTAGFVAAFVGTFVLGLFVYYGVRPLHRRLADLTDRRGLTAGGTLLLVVVPALELLTYAGLVAVDEFVAAVGPATADAVLARLPGDSRSFEVVVQSPGELVAAVERGGGLWEAIGGGVGAVATAGNAVLHLTLALAFAFFDGPRLAAWFRSDVAAADGVADAYLSAVDADLQTVYFGNVLTVLAVGAAAVVVYHGFNLLAPAALRIPFPTLLALLTGLATFVPIVVGKLVYLPATAVLGWTAVRTGNPELWPWVAGFPVVAFLVLDLVPQTVVRPYVSGRSLHGGLILFAYVLGTALFGWYGLFLGPFLAVCVVQAANVVLPELLGGDRLTPDTHTDIGSDPDVDDESGATEDADDGAADGEGGGTTTHDAAADGPPTD
jgi:predicted PurR-regulated permease PerM